jgi:hypothetical protein
MKGEGNLRIGKLTYLIFLIGITSLIFTNSFESYLAKSFASSNGYYKWNIISAHVNNILDPQGTSSFTLADMHILEEHSFKNRDIAYSAVASTNAQYNNRTTKVDIYGVNYKYNKFHKTKLNVGKFLNIDNEYENVAVIDETVAEKFFGNYKVIGRHIELYNRKFKIIGVVEGGKSFLDTLTDNGYGKIFIGVPQLLELDTNAKITSLDVKTTDSSTIGINLDELGAALSSIGKSSSNYNITDLNIEKVLIEQKSKLSIFMIGFILIVILFLKMKKIFQIINKLINNSLRDYYFIRALRINFKILVIEIAKLLILFFFIFLLWHKIKFYLYIPSEYIPNDLTDTNFYTNLFKSKIQTSLLNEGYIRTQMEIKLTVVKSLINQSYYVGLFSGLPLVYLAYYQNKIIKLRRDLNE